MELYAAIGRVFSAWSRAKLPTEYVGSELRQAIASLAKVGAKIYGPLLLGLLAEREADAEELGGAANTINEALSRATDGGENWTNAFLHRVRGDILLKRNPSDPAPAEEAYQKAIAIARAQGARSYELLASLSLAKLYQSTARPAEAHAVLVPALEGFSPTPEMPQIAEAQALVATLAETDEVKSAIEQQQRRGQLQVAYGNALIAARGFGAPETIEAFARARERAPADAPERLAADFGLWAASYPRGLCRGLSRRCRCPP